MVDLVKATDVIGKAAALYANKLQSSPAALEYARSRGLDDHTIEQFGIGFAPDNWDTITASASPGDLALLEELALIQKSEKGRHYDFFRNRLMFPIKDYDGHVVGFGGRVINGDDSPKYLNTPETVLFKKRNIIFNLNEVARANVKSIVITEGYLDVIKAHSVGFRNFGCVMGASFGRQHADMILKANIEHVCFCFDGDRAGLEAAFKSVTHAAYLQQSGVRVMYSFCPSGTDPDDIISKGGKEAMIKQLGSSLTLAAVAGISCVDDGLFKVSKFDAVLAYEEGVKKLCVDTGLDYASVLSEGASNSSAFTDLHVGVLSALSGNDLKASKNTSLTRGV